MKLHCKRIILMDENIIHPNCNACGKELVPYLIEEGLTSELLELLLKCDLILGKKDDKYVALLCSNCLSLKKIGE